METSDEKFTKKGRTNQERQAIIEQWEASGKSKKEFCTEQGVNYYTLMSWLAPKKKKFRQVKSVKTIDRFSEVKLPLKSTSDLFARISVGKVSLDIFQPVSTDFLLRLLHA